MSEDTGARLARLANERRLLTEARAEAQRSQAELTHAQSEANLEYLRAMLTRMVAGFNRTVDPTLHVTLRVEDRRIYMTQTYTTLLILSFEPDAVTVESAPPERSRRRFRFTPAEGGGANLIEADRPQARPGSAESFAEGVLALALGLYAS